MSTNEYFLHFKLKAVIWAYHLTRAEALEEARDTVRLWAITRDIAGKGLLLAKSYAIRQRLTRAD